MPTVGERRSAGGETREWNGTRWEAITPDARSGGMTTPLVSDPLADLLKRADALTAGGGNADHRYDEAVQPVGPRNIPDAVRNLQDPGQRNYFQRHPGRDTSDADYTHAALESGFDTARKFGRGVAMAVPRAVGNLPQLPGQIAEGLAGEHGLPALLQDPSLLGEMGGAVQEGVQYLGDNPEAGGDLLGQLLAGKYIPEAAPSIARGAIDLTGKAGRGLQAAGDLVTRGSDAVMGEAKGLVRPSLGVLGKVTGKGTSLAGRALEGLSEMARNRMADKTWAGDASAVKPEGFTPQSTELPYRVAGDLPSVEPSGPRTFNDEPYIPAGMMDRAAKMGDATLDTLRKGGYDVPERGFRSSRDIDRLANGPLEVDLTDELDGGDSPLAKLAARSAERFGRRYRPEN